MNRGAIAVRFYLLWTILVGAVSFVAGVAVGLVL